MLQNPAQEILEIVSTIIEKYPKDISLDAHLVQDVGANSIGDTIPIVKRQPPSEGLFGMELLVTDDRVFLIL
ncbi:MAG: hypothetical protein AABY84_10485 [Candidatus Firestonebacteria bacterium]